MRICPKCGGPFSGEDEVILSSKDLKCDRCEWTGMASESIFVSDSLTGKAEFQSQLERLYVGMAQEVAPVIGKLLIQTGMVLGPDGKNKEEDQRRIRFLARVLQGSTRGAVEGIANAIAREMNYGRN